MSDTEPNPIRDAIAEAIAEHDTILFMKGTPTRPRAASPRARSRCCSHWRRRSRRSTSCPTRASARSSRRSRGWPTIPQLFVKGELVGGCDIVTEMYESGELAEALGCDRCARTHAEPAATACSPRGSPRSRTGSDNPLIYSRDLGRPSSAAGALGPRPYEPVASSPTPRSYLPRELADSEGVHQVSLYVGWQGQPAARDRARRLRRVLQAAGHRPRAAHHLTALDRRFPRRVGAAARQLVTTSSRSISPAASRARASPRGRPTGCWPSAGWASASR